MKKLFKYEINESIAAKAAMNCCKKRMLKELYALGSPMPQEEVVNGEYDPYEWEFDDYGNEDKRQLVIQALVQAGLIQSEQEGLSLNNKIQQLLDKTSFSVSNEQDAMKFVKAYGQQIVGKAQEQEETDYTNDDIPSYHFSYQNSFLVWAMRHVIPYLKEMSQVCAQADPTELKHAVMKVLKEEGRFGAPESERGCEHWAEEKCWKVEEFLGGSTQEQEEYYDDPHSMSSLQRHDMMQKVTQCMAEVLEERGIDVGGDLDEIYFIISDIIERTGDVPQFVEDGGYYPWCEEYVFDVEDLL